MRRTLAVLAGLVVLLLIVVGAGVALVTGAGNGVARIPNAIVPVDAPGRPAASDSTTFLVVGNDSRSAASTSGTEFPTMAGFGPGRADAIMLATVQADGTSGSVVSIPRDSWVDVPGHGMNKINASYALGGPALLVQTVENLTGVHVDHVGVIDFAGFRSLVDSVGGIDVRVAAPTRNIGVSFHAGVNHLDGEQALAYVHQRYDLPGGDLDRARRQQSALRALLERLQQQAGENPAALLDFARHVGDSVSVDDTLGNGDLVRLAVAYRGLRSSGVTFVTAPVASVAMEGDQSVVRLDDAVARDLWGSVRNGSVAAFANLHPTESLGDTPS